MDNNNNPTPANQVPLIPESEMKLPEEQFKEGNPAPVAKKSLGTIILLVLVALLLGVMAAVIFWGEEILNLVLPPEPVEVTTPMEEPAPEATEEQSIDDMESEIENMDFTEMENELNEIEAEIEAEATATTTS